MCTCLLKDDIIQVGVRRAQPKDDFELLGGGGRLHPTPKKYYIIKTFLSNMALYYKLRFTSVKTYFPGIVGSTDMFLTLSHIITELKFQLSFWRLEKSKTFIPEKKIAEAILKFDLVLISDAKIISYKYYVNVNALTNESIFIGSVIQWI